MVATLAAAATATAAAAETVPVRLDFVSRAGCGTAAEVARRVALRSARIDFSPAASGGQVVRVEMDRSAAGRFDVSLTFAGRAGRPSSRRIDTGSCDEALDAIALIVVVTLDPSTVGAAPPATPPPPSAPARPSQPSSPSPPPPEPPADAVPPPEAPPAIVNAPTPRAATFTLAAGVDGRGASAPSPAIMFGFGVYARAGWDRSSIWSPRIGVAAAYFPERSVAATGGTAVFSLALVALDLCPVWLRLGAFGLGGCAEATGGWMSARGTETFAPQAQRRPVAATGASAALTWEPGAAIEIVGFVAGGFSLIRDQFQFSPAVFHEVPRLTLTAGVGAGVRFW
jgi:hypothetical protein